MTLRYEFSKAIAAIVQVTQYIAGKSREKQLERCSNNTIDRRMEAGSYQYKSNVNLNSGTELVPVDFTFCWHKLQACASGPPKP